MKKNADELVAEVRQQFGTGALTTLGWAPPVEWPSISTGVESLDRALGVGGYPRGRVIEVGGSPAATLLALRAIASVQGAQLTPFGDVRLGEKGVAMYVDTRHELDLEVARRLGVQIERVLVSQPDTGEQALEIVEVCARSGAVDLIVVDSVAGLTPCAQIDGDEVAEGLQARLMSQALRKLTGVAHRVGTTLLFVRPEAPTRAAAFGVPEVLIGGHALRFYASVRIDVRAHPEAGEMMLRAKVVKNKLAPPFQEAVFAAGMLDLPVSERQREP